MKKALLLVLLCFPAMASPALAQKSFVNGLSNGDLTITCDLPGSQHMQNIGSKVMSRDKFGRPYSAGMCVFSSLEMAALYHGLEQMRGFRNWVADNYEGGGWPEKVDSVLADWFRYKNIPPIKYLNMQGLNTDKATEVAKLADKTGRMLCMTYGYSPRYGQSIQHMVCGVMYKGKYGVVLDNNFVGEDRYEWVDAPEFVRRTIYPNKTAWLFVWMHPGPPPSPRNKPSN